MSLAGQKTIAQNVRTFSTGDALASIIEIIFNHLGYVVCFKYILDQPLVRGFFFSLSPIF